MMRSIIAAIVLVLAALQAIGPSPILAGGAGRGSMHWMLQKTPTSANLLDISCASALQCMAVGANATIITTVNGGKTWAAGSPFGAAHPATPFVSVRCPLPGVCSVLAGPNTVLRTINGGRTWQSHTITLPSTLSGLGRIACPIRSVCYATASPSGSTFTWFTHSAAIYKTSDGNQTWQQLTIPSSVPCPGDCGQPMVGYDLQWISCQNGQNCFAGGDTFIGSHEGYASGVLRTRDGGTTWTLVHSSFDPNIATCPTIWICTGIFYQPLTPNIGPYLNRSTDGASSWITKSISPVLTSIACTGKNFCALAGPQGNLATASGMILSTEMSPTTHNLNAIACPRMGICYAVGAGGTVVKLAP